MLLFGILIVIGKGKIIDRYKMFRHEKFLFCYSAVQREEDPQGRIPPVAVTGRPISSETTLPPCVGRMFF